jgi:hypothetical protein
VDPGLGPCDQALDLARLGFRDLQLGSQSETPLSNPSTSY